jgi:hypothetical protein
METVTKKGKADVLLVRAAPGVDAVRIVADL